MSEVARALALAIARALPIVLVALAAHAETRWISDELRVPLRSGPSGQHTILHWGLPAGTALEVLQRDAASGFARIRTAGGSEGWVETQYLAAEPIARDRLPVLLQQIETLEATVAELRAQLGVAEPATGTAAHDSTPQQVATPRSAHQERVGAEPGAERQLEILNERLRREIEDLGAANAALQDNLQQRWLLIGSGILLGGLLLGALIKSRPRRSAWS